MQQQIEKFRLTKTVVIKQEEHANLDSFSLRYGFVFEKDTLLEIHCDPSTLKPDKNPKNKDFYNIIAKFVNPSNNRTERGVFYLINNQNNKYYEHDKVVTVIRYLDDTETEHHLSEVMKSLRKSKVITPEWLIKMHPLYMDRKLKTHADLIELLVEKKSNVEILGIQSIADKALERYKKLENEINELTGEMQILKEENIQINIELKEYRNQESIANSEGSTQTLEREKILGAVNTEVNHRGSLCTELVMEDGVRLYMKIIAFDSDLSVTAKAKKLVGKKVRTSCWDPIREPGKWSSQGYFRNLYVLSDKDVY